MALYARQVKAAERAVANSEMRIKVAEELLDLNLFSISTKDADPLTREFLQIKRQAVMDRLRGAVAAEQHEPAQPNTTQPSTDPIVATGGVTPAQWDAESEEETQQSESPRELLI